MKEKIDLNADIGESFGTYKLGEDENIVSFISSANIATGFHAGDPNWMKITIDLSLSNNVKIGAHPSYPDLHGFGRRNMDLNSLEIENIIKYQVGSMIGFTGLENLQPVKPHGALYNKAVNAPLVAHSIINAIKSISSESSSRISAARAPWPGDGVHTSMGSFSVLFTFKPKRAIPAAANTVPS